MSQKKVGTLPKDTTSGPFADDWKRAFGDISKDVDEVDITPALSAAFAIKDPEELVSLLAVFIGVSITDWALRFLSAMPPERAAG